MAKSFQFFWLFVQTFLGRHKKDLVFGFIFGFFIALFVLQIYPFYIKYAGKQSLRIGIVGKYNDSNLPLFIQKQLSLGLTDTNNSQEVIPSLAEKWEIEENETKYIIHLKNNIFWHNGAKFTGYDVNYKLKDVAFNVLDDYTLEIKLKEPFAPLLSLLTKPIFKENLNGLGNYKVKKATYSGYEIQTLAVESNIESLPKITYKFYPNSQDALLAFKKGEINVLQNMFSAYDLDKWPNVNVIPVTMYDKFVGLFFNLKNADFKEKEARQAFAYAIPNFEQYEKAYTPISPLSYAYSPKIRLYKYDPDIAKKIFAKTPFASSSSELTLSTYPLLLQEAQTIAESLIKAGVNVKVKVENSIPPDFDLFLFTMNIPTDPDQYQYWQSTQESTNFTNYSNLKIDKLLEDGRKTTDIEKRKKIYADFQRYLVDDAPVIFLYHPKVYNIEKK